MCQSSFGITARGVDLSSASTFWLTSKTRLVAMYFKYSEIITDAISVNITHDA